MGSLSLLLAGGLSVPADALFALPFLLGLLDYLMNFLSIRGLPDYATASDEKGISRPEYNYILSLRGRRNS